MYNQNKYSHKINNQKTNNKENKIEENEDDTKASFDKKVEIISKFIVLLPFLILGAVLVGIGGIIVGGFIFCCILGVILLFIK